MILVQTKDNNSTNLANIVQAQDSNPANLADQGTPREVLIDPQDGSLRQLSGQATYLAEFAKTKLHISLVQTRDRNTTNLADQGTPREVLTDPQDGSLRQLTSQAVQLRGLL